MNIIIKIGIYCFQNDIKQTKIMKYEEFCLLVYFQDGHIDFREFMIVLYIMSNGSPEENLKQIFRVFDINNDGTITLKVS